MQSIEVPEESCRAVSVDGDESKVVRLFGEFKDHAARKDTGHQGTVDNGDFCEYPRRGDVAAVLAEEDGNTTLGQVRHDLVVAGNGEGRVTTPRVAVEREHIHAGHISVVARGGTLEIVPRINQDVPDVRRTVPHGDAPF